MKIKSAAIIHRNTIQNHSRKNSAVLGLLPETESDRQFSQKIRCFTEPLELLQYLNLTPEQVELSSSASQQFKFKVPFSYVQNIKHGDPYDPLLRQVLPVKGELKQAPGFTQDPLDENNSQCQPGMLKKYHGRVLLLTTPGCVINCRYCFRRHYPYSEKGHVWSQICDNIALIKQDLSIQEVILSGGDPLSLSDTKLVQLLSMLESIPQLKRIRIHTRYPIAAPERVTPVMLQRFAQSSLKIIMVLHINHPDEIGQAARAAIYALQQTRVPLYNQSVLLKGVNDTLDVLTKLNETLFEHGIQAYYLHLLDRISGTVHFDLDEKYALRLYRQLRAALPGYMVPTLVREIAGEQNKIPFY